MQKGYEIKEIYNTNEKDIEEKLQEIFMIFLTEKITENPVKYIAKREDTIYNQNSWIEGTNCYRREET